MNATEDTECSWLCVNESARASEVKMVSPSALARIGRNFERIVVNDPEMTRLCTSDILCAVTVLEDEAAVQLVMGQLQDFLEFMVIVQLQGFLEFMGSRYYRRCSELQPAGG